MFDHLQIDHRRERWLVGCADLALRPLGDIGGWRRTTPRIHPRRVLLFRLERIGDLLMTLGALGAVRRRLPDAELRLVVGSWNAGLARLLPAVDHVETLDVPWLARGERPSALRAVAAQVAAWRRRSFDLAINFEPDIRSNALLAASGARRRVGYGARGGAAFLTDALGYDLRRHVAANARDLVDRALPARRDRSGPGSTAHARSLSAGSAAGGPPGPADDPAALRIPEGATRAAARLLASCHADGPLIGLNPGAGRAVKEWPPGHFGRAASVLAGQQDATIVLLGSAAERAKTKAVTRAIASPARVLDLAGKAPLAVLAAVLSRLALLITGDTGPMHLAAAVGTPVVAIFGPSDPARYAPLHARSAVVRADLWCRPCNRVRRPPARCRGGTPDCLTGVSVDAVVDAARRVLRAGRGASPTEAGFPR